jgi:hypothetical protein
VPGLALKEVELPLGVAAALVGSDPSSSKIGTSVLFVLTDPGSGTASALAHACGRRQRRQTSLREYWRTSGSATR